MSTGVRAKVWYARLRGMAPSVISSGSDNDPTTVASLAVIGSTTVYGLGWLVVLVIPMLAVVQAISSQIGLATRAGLEDIVRRRYGRWAAWAVLLAVLSVNVLTLAADLEGGGAALGLLSPLDYRWWIVPLAALSVVLLVRGNYRTIERVLVYVPMAFIAYAVAAFIAKPVWADVLRGSFVPHLQTSHAYVAGAIALLGTTLTAYAYVWQEIEIAEEKPPLRRLGLVQIDAAFGALAAGVTFWFIVIATGATLGVHHKPVQTAADAALALTPLAGHFAAVLFGIGLLGSALLAIPVLIVTSAYVAGEMFGWVGKLDSHFFEAPRFYGTMIAVTVVSCAIAYAGIGPIRLLFASSIAGGIATPVTLVFMLLAAADRKAMGERRIATWLYAAGWATTALVSTAAAIYLYQTLTGHN
jgi:Mn2+/Fe2+ NRAMP family transporter